MTNFETKGYEIAGELAKEMQENKNFLVIVYHVMERLAEAARIYRMEADWMKEICTSAQQEFGHPDYPEYERHLRQLNEDKAFFEGMCLSLDSILPHIDTEGRMSMCVWAVVERKPRQEITAEAILEEFKEYLDEI